MACRTQCSLMIVLNVRTCVWVCMRVCVCVCVRSVREAADAYCSTGSHRSFRRVLSLSRPWRFAVTDSMTATNTSHSEGHLRRWWYQKWKRDQHFSSNRTIMMPNSKDLKTLLVASNVLRAFKEGPIWIPEPPYIGQEGLLPLLLHKEELHNETRLQWVWNPFLNNKVHLQMQR